jgi:hypothetical protein
MTISYRRGAFNYILEIRRVKKDVMLPAAASSRREE